MNKGFPFLVHSYPLYNKRLYVYMKKIKEEDLILYLYQEASPGVTEAIETALAEHDFELTDRLNLLRRTIRQLGKLKLKQPSKQSLKTIIKHAGESLGNHKH